MDNKRLMKIAEYVAMQCMGCSDSPHILSYKAFEVMKNAVNNKENPYKALNDFLGTHVSEEILKDM